MKRAVLGLAVALIVVGGVTAVLLRRDTKEDLGTEPGLARELLAMEREDQRARGAAGSDTSVNSKVGREIVRVDRKNTARLEEILDEYGWPGRTLVGERASRSAWVIAQHADLDPQFQKHALELMKGMPSNEVEIGDVAYLTDRVLVAERKPQQYGTQWECRKGELVPRTPIAKPAEEVEERRAEVGMEPLAKYRRSLADHFGACPEEDA